MKKFARNESGSVTIVVAMMMVVLIGVSALVIDYGNLAGHQRQLQNAVDAACLAAAQYLPDHTDKAEDAAEDYLNVNAPGASLQSVTFSYTDKQVTVTASWDVDYQFARAVMANSSKTISADATAVITNVLGPFDYALFSGSEIDLLQFTGQNYITGDIHANYNIKNIATVIGTVTAAGIIDGKITATNKVPGYSVLTMPDFSDVVSVAFPLSYDTMIAYGATESDGNYTMSPTQLNTMLDAYADQTIYIDGSLTINGSGVCATGCVITSGDITFNGSGVNMGAWDAMSLCSLNGDITFDGANAIFRGILFAPNGEVRFNGKVDMIFGAVIGDVVRGNGGLHIYYDSAVKNSVPDTKIMLID